MAVRTGAVVPFGGGGLDDLSSLEVYNLLYQQLTPCWHWRGKLMLETSSCRKLLFFPPFCLTINLLLTLGCCCYLMTEFVGKLCHLLVQK